MQIHPYAAELAEKVKQKSDRCLTVKFRALLNGFGYQQRSEAAIAEMHRHLSAVGLAANFSIDVPRKLDDKVVIIPAAPGNAAASKSSPAGEPLDPIARAIEATVEVIAGEGRGSGFIVHPDGLVITARHVVDDADRRSLRTVNVRLAAERENERVLEGVVFRSHHLLDYALVWLTANGPFSIIPLGDPQKLRHAQTIFAIGSHAGRPNTVSRGVVSNPTGRFGKLQCIQTDAAIDHGNSGGPLVTEDGQVVGINLWGIGHFAAAKFSLPIDYMADDIGQALLMGRAKCLQAQYCSICGWADHAAPTWYCRNCGTQFESQQPASAFRWRAKDDPPP